jgi:hypothetical protein
MRVKVEIPKRTYVGVPTSIIHAGGRPTFRDEEWSATIDLKPLAGLGLRAMVHERMWNPAAGRGPSATPNSGHDVRVLPLVEDARHPAGRGDPARRPEADAWLRRARFDGRAEGVAPKDDRFDMIGWHCYMSPEVAAEGLVRLSHLPKHNEPLPNDDYPDLSQMEIFR